MSPEWSTVGSSVSQHSRFRTSSSSRNEAAARGEALALVEGMEAVWSNHKQTQAEALLLRATRSGGRSVPARSQLGRRPRAIQRRPVARRRSIAFARATRILPEHDARSPECASRCYGAQLWWHTARRLCLGFPHLCSGRHLWRARVERGEWSDDDRARTLAHLST